MVSINNTFTLHFSFRKKINFNVMGNNFINNNISYISLISSQKDELRVSTFDIEGKNNFINSSIYDVKNLKRINGSGIKQSSTKSLKKQGVIIPLVSNEAFFLTIVRPSPSMRSLTLSVVSLSSSQYLSPRGKTLLSITNLRIVPPWALTPSLLGQ